MNSASQISLVIKCAEAEKTNLQSKMDEAELQRKP